MSKPKPDIFRAEVATIEQFGIGIIIIREVKILHEDHLS
jgi:hypothetical protein